LFMRRIRIPKYPSGKGLELLDSTFVSQSALTSLCQFSPLLSLF
jgi:hypothetical protein